MSARDDIAAHFTSDSLADQLLDAYRTEVFGEAIAALRGLHDLAPDGPRAPQLAFAVGVLMGARDFPAEEKATAPAATATPRLDGRLAMLLDAIRTHQGRWTTRRVQRLYRLPGINAPQRGAARRDLHALHSMGHLTLCGPENGRYYLLTRKDGRA
ncbi:MULTISPECIES: hypothetical protein [unclassified Streptomyces]|uniref:hypothetical protein n=1 Tax=unclassified Streptomyces TaxID=2593676 RepID=UPI002E19D66A|nr:MULTISPECIES: hypothetical protein [unclassified Streptomyces]